MQELLIVWRVFSICAVLLSAIVALGYMLKVRHAGAMDSTILDVLIGTEWFITIVTMLFGGMVIPGSIFYYGWRTRFPVKARSVRHIEWVIIGVYFVGVILSFFLFFVFYLPNLQQTDQLAGQNMVNQLEQQHTQQVQQQQQNLVSGVYQSYTGNGFSLSIPSGWTEDTTLEQQYPGSIVWESNGANLSLTINSTDDTSNAPINAVERENTAGAASGGQVVSHPAIPGATETTLIAPKIIQPDFDDSVTLYAHGNGKVYTVIGSIPDTGTAVELTAITQSVLTFKITQ